MAVSIVSMLLIVRWFSLSLRTRNAPQNPYPDRIELQPSNPQIATSSLICGTAPLASALFTERPAAGVARRSASAHHEKVKLKLSKERQELHDRLVEMRKKITAHSDSEMMRMTTKPFDVPMRDGEPPIYFIQTISERRHRPSREFFDRDERLPAGSSLAVLLGSYLSTLTDRVMTRNDNTPFDTIKCNLGAAWSSVSGTANIVENCAINSSHGSADTSKGVFGTLISRRRKSPKIMAFQCGIFISCSACRV